MITPELVEYIKSHLAAGKSEGEVREALLAAGWQEPAISEAFNAVKSGVVLSHAPVSSGTARGFGDLISQAFRIYRDNFGAFFALSLTTILPFIAVSYITGVKPLILLVLVIAAIVVLVSSQLGIYYFANNYQKSPAISEAFSFGLRKFFPYLWIGILNGLVIALGFVLFIIPGFFFATWFAFSIMVLVDEDLRGSTALLKSRYYIRGRGVSVFLKLFLVGVLTALISVAGAALFNLLGKTVGSIASAALSVLITPFTAIFVTELYKDIKSLKDQTIPFQVTFAQKALIVCASVLALLIPIAIAFLLLRHRW